MFEILWENAEIHFKQTEYNMDLKSYSNVTVPCQKNNKKK